MGRPSLSLADRLVELVRRSSAMGLHELEKLDRGEITSRLVPQVEQILQEGIALFSSVLDDFSSVSDERDDEAEGDARPMVDLAYVGRLELRQRLEWLRTAAQEPRCLTPLEVCDGCLGAIRRSAAALESALAAESGREPQIHSVGEVQLARRIRSQYARLRRDVSLAGPPAEEELASRLRHCGTSLACLTGLDIFAEMRIGDRDRLKSLQQRLVSWLGGKEDQSPDSGLRLWQDLHTFTILLRGINLRSELQEHDRQIIETAVHQLCSTPTEQPQLSTELLGRLGLLEGLDDEVDALLSGPQDADAEAWCRNLDRLRGLMRSHKLPEGLSADTSPPDHGPEPHESGSPSHPASSTRRDGEDGS